MTDLSPQAQAVITASNCAGSRIVQLHIAAALQAAADQVVPKIEKPPARDGHDLSIWQWMVDCWSADQATRAKLLAIAAELEGNDD
jgi:hypothetical protein